MFAVDTDSLLQRDKEGKPVADPETGRYKLVREGTAMETFKNTVVHELFHALMHDYNRTGMAGGTSLADIQLDSTGDFPTYAARIRYRAYSFPKWFKEGTASAVENNYQFRYDEFQLLRRLQDSNGMWGVGDINPVFTTQLLLNNYVRGCIGKRQFAFNDLQFAEGGSYGLDIEIDPEMARYVTGYLATLYLCELTARYGQDGQSSVQLTGGVVTRVDSGRLRGGLDTMLRWMHEGATLDSVIRTISPKDGEGRPIYTDTASFEDLFIKGRENSESEYEGDSESQAFVTNLLNYFLSLDSLLPEGQHTNGSILADFDTYHTSPLDPNRQSSSEFLQVTDSNALVPSTVASDTAGIGGGKSDPDQASTETASDDEQSDRWEEWLSEAAKTDSLAGPDSETTDEETEGKKDQTEADSESSSEAEAAAEPTQSEPAVEASTVEHASGGFPATESASAELQPEEQPVYGEPAEADAGSAQESAGE